MRLPDAIAKRTEEFFSRRIKPEVLFIASMVCLAIFLFLPTAASIWKAVMLFFILTLLKRGKAKVASPLLITAGIVFFALLSPHGKVLFRIWKLTVTQGALETGGRKSGTLIGMVFISQFALSPSLHIPGKAGVFFSSVFSTFDKLTKEGMPLKFGSIISSIDNRLLDIWQETKTPDTDR